MLTLRILCHGTLKEEYLRAACAEYKKRLGAYGRVEILEAKDDRTLASYIREKEYTVALCIEGKELSSEQLAQKFQQWATSGVSAIALVIGSSYGLHPLVKQQAALRLSMSPMTFPHHLARVMLLEQVYRAFKINEGSLYHK